MAKKWVLIFVPSLPLFIKPTVHTKASGNRATGACEKYKPYHSLARGCCRPHAAKYAPGLPDVYLLRPFYQVCIRCYLCGLGTPRPPTECFTSARDSSSDVYFNDQRLFRPDWCFWETLSWRPTFGGNLLRSFVRSRGRLAVMLPALRDLVRDPRVGPGLHKQNNRRPC